MTRAWSNNGNDSISGWGAAPGFEPGLIIALGLMAAREATRQSHDDRDFFSVRDVENPRAAPSL